MSSRPQLRRNIARTVLIAVLALTYGWALEVIIEHADDAAAPMLIGLAIATLFVGGFWSLVLLFFLWAWPRPSRTRGARP